jgi:hypothetical protein
VDKNMQNLTCSLPHIRAQAYELNLERSIRDQSTFSLWAVGIRITTAI